MKHSKLGILCFIFLMATAFGDINAQVIAEGYYEGVYIKYGKHLIQASLNEDSINNVNYMNNVESFLEAIHAQLDTIYAMNRFWCPSGVYVMTIIKLLNDTMDALDYISVIQNSGFFLYVQPCEVPEELGGFPQPNDQLFPDQAYLYQERGPLDPNNDISVPVGVLRVKRPPACQDALHNSMACGQGGLQRAYRICLVRAGGVTNM